MLAPEAGGLYGNRPLAMCSLLNTDIEGSDERCTYSCGQIIESIGLIITMWSYVN
jgi:hypothetical protein